jgi:hypothetical protein
LIILLFVFDKNSTTTRNENWGKGMTLVGINETSQAPAANNDAPPRASAPTQADDAGERTARTVAEIVAGAKDGGGERIDCVYFKREAYAIYRRGTPPQIVVAYSDTPAVADQQIAAISPLLPSRDHLVHLMNNLPAKSQENYRAQIADALRLGLEKQPDIAKALIAKALEDALAAQARIERLVYLQWAGMAIVPALVLILFGGRHAAPDAMGVNLLLMSAGAGAIGAVLSIAIAIRARTVAIEGNWKANAVDAAVRVGIGMISAAVLFLLLNSGVVATLTAGGVSLTGDKMTWQVALIIGFAAGFLERLVPDLLEKGAPPSQPAQPASAGGTGGGAPPKSTG